jgi:AraC-like DNA-binding protein
MPHTWVSTSAIDESRLHIAEVIWFTGEWAFRLAELCPEFSGIRKLMKRATSALQFPAAAGARMESLLPGLLSRSPLERLQTALSLLSGLADTEATALATVRQKPSDECAQLTRVLEVLQKRFAEPIRMEDLCAAGNVSPRTLHRLFVRHLGESASDYLGRLRIGRACMLLVEKDWPISLIAAEAGFSNLSNFNRRFLASRRMTPKEFRQFVARHGRIPEPPPTGDLTKRSPSLEAPRNARTLRGGRRFQSARKS